MGQKQRKTALQLIGVIALGVCSAPIWLFPMHQAAPRPGAAGLDGGAKSAPEPLSATALGAGWLLGPASSRGYPVADPDRSDPSPPGEIKLSFLVGQLVMAGMDGTQPDAELLRQARDGEIGGVLLFSSSAGLPGAMQALQDAARGGDNPPLLIATDQEGGTVNRLSGPPRSPRLIDSEAVADSEGAATASLLAASHVNVDLAPVADVISPGGFEARQGRGFSGTSERVAALATAFAAGLQRGRVAATAKHFPGIGSLALDTDHTLGQLQVSPAALSDQLVPFRRLIEHDVSLVMLANIVLLSLYTLSCHSVRHLVGGKLDCFSCTAATRTRHTGWRGASCSRSSARRSRRSFSCSIGCAATGSTGCTRWRWREPRSGFLCARSRVLQSRRWSIQEPSDRSSRP